MNTKNIQESDVFSFLEAVRESGLINMMDAAPSIMKEFGVSKKESKEYLMNWIFSK